MSLVRNKTSLVSSVEGMFSTLRVVQPLIDSAKSRGGLPVTEHNICNYLFDTVIRCLGFWLG